MADWRERYHYQGNLWIYPEPEIVYQAKLLNVGYLTFQNVVRTLTEGTVISGALGNIKPNMTVLLGTNPGGDDLGRVRAIQTAGSAIIVWSPLNIHDGEAGADLGGGDYVTVVNDYRMWMKAPYAASGSYFYDGQLGPQGCTYEQIPIANGGAAYGNKVSSLTGAITVTHDASDSFAVADDAVLGAYTADLFGGAETLTASSGTPANAIDGNTATYWQPTNDTHEYMHVDFGDGVEKTIRKSTLTCSTNFGPTEWSLQWSDDNANWVTAFYGVEAAWGVNEQRTYENHHAGAHRYWRLYVYQSTGGFDLRIEEWELFAEDRTSGASPYLWIVDNGVVTAGSTTSNSITIEYPMGSQFTELQITDTNAEVGVTQIPVVGCNTTKARFWPDELWYGASVKSATDERAGFEAYRAFDNSNGTAWLTNNGVTTATLTIEFPYAKQADSYGIVVSDTTRAPKDWTLDGSQNGSDWDNLDTQAGITTWGVLVEKTFSIASPDAYKYYRLVISANTGGNYVGLIELNLYGADPIPANGTCIENFQVISHTMEQAGQVYEFQVNEAIPPSSSVENFTEDLYTGVTIAASTFGGGAAGNAFDNNDATFWRTDVAVGTGWLRVGDWTAGITKILAYGITQQTDHTEAPTAWTFEGSPDTVAWDVLDTQSGITWSGGGTEEQKFTLDATARYLYYRINVTAVNGGSRVRINELNLYVTTETITPLYIDGSMVLYWEDDYYDNVAGSLSAAGSTGREHMRLHGWIDTEQNSFEGGDRAIDERLVLRCLDPGQRLQQLIDFTFMAQRDVTPTVGYEMKHANMDVYFYLMVRWLSTGAEVTDFIWSFTTDHYNFGLLAAQGANIYDMVNQKARAIDHIFTCNKMGQLQIVPDLRNCANEFRANAPTIESLTAADYLPLDFTYSRTARFHWAYGSGVGFFPYDATSGSFAVDARFTIAPGQTPGQGVTSDTEHERLIALSDNYDRLAVTPVTSLNERTGRSYAQKAAYRSIHTITLVHAGDTGLDPAEAQWLPLTIPATLATYRGRTLDAANGIILRITEQPDHSAMTKTVTIEWEKFISDFVDAWSYFPT